MTIKVENIKRYYYIDIYKYEKKPSRSYILVTKYPLKQDRNILERQID